MLIISRLGGFQFEVGRASDQRLKTGIGDRREHTVRKFPYRMLNIYTESEKLGYQPKKFRAMVNRDGAKETADKLLAMSTTSSGFTALFLLGREALKLSVEYLVLQRPWRDLFDESQLTEPSNQN